VKVIVRQESLRRILQGSQRALFACAILLLGYCVFSLGDAWLFQRRAARDLDRLRPDRRAASRMTPQPVSATAPKAPPAAEGSLIGRIAIPRLLLSEVVVEGIDRTSLRRAVGHIPGTALPGEDGNVGLAGHRDTYFRPLRNIRRDDVISLTTPLGEYRYRVVSTRIVSPSGVAVLDPSVSEVLTLVTCYPFYYIGPAPGRFIVRAERIL